MPIQCTDSVIYHLNDTKPLVTVYNDNEVGLHDTNYDHEDMLRGIGYCLRFTPAQIPAVRKLLAALEAKVTDE